MSRVRTFIAVDIGKTIRERLVVLQDRLARAAGAVKWTEPENLHVTLLFLGEVDERELPAVCRVVEQETASVSQFEMSVEQLGCFPNARRPRVIWAGVTQGREELCAIHDRLEPPLLELGCYRREERKFTPHVTLGRVRADRQGDGLARELERHCQWQGGQTPVHEVLVMRSELRAQGPSYTVLSRPKLRGEQA
jgi:2'-5' RNA ligase